MEWIEIDESTLASFAWFIDEGNTCEWLNGEIVWLIM